MTFDIRPTTFPDVWLFQPKTFADQRGYFFECFHEQRYEQVVAPLRFVQDNVSRSLHGVLRGLHFQNPGGQGKLVQVLFGTIYDVVVDIRPHSPSFLRWQGFELTSDNPCQLWVPPAFAHGFVVTSQEAIVHYKVTDYYQPQNEHSLRWNDPALKITWPISQPVLSAKDAAAPDIELMMSCLPNS